eukprot:3149474-Pleurochrysis_carterae.AAC.1
MLRVQKKRESDAQPIAPHLQLVHAPPIRARSQEPVWKPLLSSRACVNAMPRLPELDATPVRTRRHMPALSCFARAASRRRVERRRACGRNSPPGQGDRAAAAAAAPL